MRSKTIGWIAAVSVMLVSAGSLGLGIAGAADSNTSGSAAKPEPRGPVADAFVMGAVVGPDGRLDRSTTSGVTSDKIGRGSYEVIFPINVRNCTYVATIGKTNAVGSAKPGFITTVGRNSQVNGVFLTTHDKRGRSADRPFHLEVACPPAA
ncbi:MAG: hypothetical protein ACXWZG_08995 [Microbacterium sp.]